MSKPHHRRAMLSRAIGHPVRRALAASGTGPDAAPLQRVALQRAVHPWPATEASS